MSDSDGQRGDDADGAGDGADTGGRPCPICEEPMYSRHCKYVCPNHGVVMDCGDVFWTG